jgi:ubiquinone/menaquinone biosynthesis C-methylase UbiE
MENRFDNHARAWDEKEYRLKLAAGVSESIKKAVDIHLDMDILDFGCGTGLISLGFAPNVRSLTGLDNSAGMLEVFQDKAKASGFNNVNALFLNLDDGDPLPGTYDMVMSSLTFHHLKNIPLVLKTLYHGLNSGGHVCIADLDLEDGTFHTDNAGVVHFGFPRDKMVIWLQEAGFSNVNVSSATRVVKPGNDGVEREFSIFLITGQR